MDLISELFDEDTSSKKVASGNLYDNLDSVTAQFKQEDLIKSLSQYETCHEEMDTRLLEQAAKIEKTKKQLAIMVRNISILYNTAKVELSRKDRVIQDLRDKVAMLQEQCTRKKRKRFVSSKPRKSDDTSPKKAKIDSSKEVNDKS